MDKIYVYTDGSCINNGKPNAKAGIGIYFGENDKRNVSMRIPGKQTNNIAELSAIILAILILKNETKQIVIYSDSIYAIKCFTTYGRKLESQGFISNKPIPNLEIIKAGLKLMRPNIELKFIRSHTGKKNEHSIGNNMAYRLAALAIGLNPDRRREYLDIGYEDRHKAKEMGAKWDWKKKRWYLER